MKVGYREALASEWIKFRTVRSMRAVALAIVAVVPALAVLVAATESLQPDDTVLGASLLGGAVLALLLAGSLGATMVTSEHRTGTIAVTMVASPRRWVVLAAKATVVGVVTGAAALAGGAAAFGAGVVMLGDGSYATGDPFPALLGVALAVSAAAVLGVGVGSLIPQSGAAVATTIGLVLLPALFAPLLGDLQRWLNGASLNGVVQKLAQSSDATPEAVGSLGGWPSLLVVVTYTCAVLALASRVLRHRDI